MTVTKKRKRRPRALPLLGVLHLPQKRQCTLMKKIMSRLRHDRLHLEHPQWPSEHLQQLVLAVARRLGLQVARPLRGELLPPRHQVNALGSLGAHALLAALLKHCSLCLVRLWGDKTTCVWLL